MWPRKPLWRILNTRSHSSTLCDDDMDGLFVPVERQVEKTESHHFGESCRLKDLLDWGFVVATSTYTDIPN